MGLGLVLALGMAQGVQALSSGAWSIAAISGGEAGERGEAEPTAAWVRSERRGVLRVATEPCAGAGLPAVRFAAGRERVRDQGTRIDVGRRFGRGLLHRQRRLLI
jgi:hypothetical protein